MNLYHLLIQIIPLYVTESQLAFFEVRRLRVFLSGIFLVIEIFCEPLLAHACLSALFSVHVNQVYVENFINV